MLAQNEDLTRSPKFLPRFRLLFEGKLNFGKIRSFVSSCAVISIMIFSIPASGGLFSSVGNALGIGGDVGKALDAADGLLPGGGGATDQILGAPGKAVFGDAIKKLGETNDKSIAKLGETNDRTVQKLLDGLGQVQAALSMDLQTIDATLSTSISSLDDTLSRSIDALNNSLNDQTLRLDTVFEKQTSSFYLIGRILLTVVIVGGLVLFAYKVVLNSPNMSKLKHLIAERRSPVFVSLAICIVALAATWLVPDSGRLKKLEQNYSNAYSRSLHVEDYTGAETAASQLTVLRPESSIYRSLELKATAFRDLILRPTLLESEDKILNLYVQMGQVNEYRKENQSTEDPDISSAYGLIAGLRAKREFDYSGVAIAFRHTVDLVAADPSHQITEDANLREIAIAFNSKLRELALPVDMFEFVIQEPNDKNVKSAIRMSSQSKQAFLDQYSKSLEAVPSNAASAKQTLESYPINSFGELSNTLSQRIYIKSFYRNLTARYNAYLDALAASKAAGAAAQKASEATNKYCELQTYYNTWYKESTSKYSGSLTFVTNLLSGPYVIVARSQALNKTPNACNAIADTAISQQADVSGQWLTTLISMRLARDSKGAILLRSAAKLNMDAQNAAFAEYEKLYEAKKDVAGTDITSVANPTSRQSQAETVISLAETAAVLGLYSQMDGKIVPAAYQLRVQYKTEGLVDIERWRQAEKAFLENQAGT
jgi:hypothetical protein